MDPFGSRFEGFGEPLETHGRTLVRGASSVDYYSGWFAKQGEHATFGVEVIDLPTDVTLTVTVQSKQLGETDGSATTEATISVTSSGAQVQTARGTSLQERLRYKYTLAGSASTGRVHFRMLTPIQEPNW